MGIRCCPLNDVAAASALRQEEWEALARLCGEIEALDRPRYRMHDRSEVEGIVLRAVQRNKIDASALFFFVAPRLQKQERFVGDTHPVYFPDWDVTFRLRAGTSLLLK